MDCIQKVSHFFLIFFKFLIVFLPLFAVFKWVFMDTAFMHSPFARSFLLMPFNNQESYVELQNINWSPLAQGIGLASYILALLPILISLYELIRIFKNYAVAEIFNVTNARYYRLIGLMFIFDGLFAQIFSGTLMTLATTWNNAPGQRGISIAFGSSNIEAIFCGTVVIVISWVMLEASKLFDEQQYTV